MEQELAYIILAVTTFLLLIIVLFSVKSWFARRSEAKASSDSEFDLLADEKGESREEPVIGQFFQTEIKDEITIKVRKSNQQSSSEQQAAVQEVTFKEQEQPQQPSSQTNSEVIVIHVMPKNNKPFMGYELLQSLLALGFRFGDMSIFHRHEQISGQGKVLFSLAQATEPGTFDIDKISDCRCEGLTIFMQLIGPEHNLNALNLMISAAKQLAQDFDGIVKNIDLGQLSQYRNLVAEHLTRIP